MVLLVVVVTACGNKARFAGSNVQPFVTTVDEWPVAYKTNFEQIQSLAGKARLTIESPDFSGNVSISSYWVNPNVLFLQAEGPFGLDVGKIYIGSNRFLIYNQYTNHFSSGSVADPYLNRFLQTDFTLSEIKFSVLGHALQPEVPIRLVDAQHGVFEARDGGLSYRYVVNPRSGLLETCEVSRNSRVFLRQQFKNYRVVGGIYVPGIVQMTMPAQKQRISIFYNELELNQPIDPKVYTIEVASKVEQLNLN